MTPGPEDEVSQAEKRSVMRREAELRGGDLEHLVPALAVGRRPPEFIDAQKEELRQRLAEAEARARACTYLDQTHSDVGGRFSVTQNEIVTGRVSNKPPPLPPSSPWGQPKIDDVPRRDALSPPVDRPPGTLGGYRILSAEEIRRALDPNPAPSHSPAAQDTGGAEAPSDPGLSEHAAPPSSSGDQ